MTETSRTYHLQGLRVTLGRPRQVTEGVGFCWFPRMARFASGELVLTHSLVADTEGNLVTGSAIFLSNDGGETWHTRYQVAEEPIVTVAQPDGAIAGSAYYLYPDPPDQGRRFKGHFCRLEEGGRRYVMEPWAVQVTGLPRDVSPSRYTGKYSREWMGQIYFDSDAVEVDGQVVSTAYVVFEGEKRYTLVALASEDYGRTWHYLSTVAGPEDAPEGREGPCEASLVQLANGDLMCVMRIGSGTDQQLARAYSADAGRSWSAVDRLPAFSVEPSLRRIANDTLVLSTGRSGIYLWFSTDACGQEWQPVDVVAYHNEVMDTPHHIHPRQDFASQTTAYTELVEVAPNRLLLVYDRIPFGWKGVPMDSEERNRIYVLPIEVKRI